MPKKKDEPKQPTEQEVLEQKVDAMMDVKHEEPANETTAATVPANESVSTDPASGLPPLDIFASSGAPEVPKELLKEVDKKVKEPKTEKAPAAPETPDETPTEPAAETVDAVPAEPTLDDDVSDAAVDEIVAEEGDTVLAVEDAAAKEQADIELPKKKAHRHPLFWTLVALIAILAVLLAFLLVTGGNVKAPGIHGAESLWHSLQNRL